MLASHVAGFRLGRVIALLLIPICYFGYVLATETLHEQALIDENRAGATLMEFTYQLMLDQVDGWSASTKQDVLLQKGPSLAATTGVAKEFGLLEMALKSPTTDKFEKLQKAANLMTAVGSGTAMNDAGNRELNLLADAASSVLPRLMVNFNRLHQIAEAAMLDKQEQTAKLPEIESTAAILEFLARELDNATLRARANSNDLKAYSSLLQQTSKFNFDATYFKLQLFDHAGDDAERLRNLESAILAQKSKWIVQFQRSWEGLNNRRQILTDLRQAELHYWEWRTLAIAFGAITLGLGTAVSMFRQTLRQLDQVENARKDANAARHDAEEGSRELAAMNDNLARMNQEVNHHLKSLEDAQEQLVKKGRMEQMGQLTATMAHELRNPLGAARTSLFLLERKTRDKGLGIESQVQRISTAIMRCDDIIGQLLDFSRTRKLNPSSGDFDGWLERTIAEEAQRLPSVVSIHCNLSLNGRMVAFDPSRMHRALSNLINNASEAMVGNGEDPTRFAVSNPRIEISSLVEGDDLVLKVADNGPGISPENLAKVREPLFTTKSFGTGLGLPAVEQIVAQHGGSLTVESTIGLGTTITLRIPVEVKQDEAA